MNSPPRTNGWMLIGLGIVFTLMVFDVHADECRGNCGKGGDSGDTILTGGDLTGGDLIGGDNTIAGSRSYGVSQSLGDVDINDCLASTQWGIPVIFAKQKVQENPWCQSIYLDAIGAHEAAAKIRCTTDTLKAAYPIESECTSAVMARPSVVVVPATTDESEPDDDDWRDALSAFKTDIEEQRTIDADNAKRYRSQAQRVAQTVPTDDAAERRARARAALKGEE